MAEIIHDVAPAARLVLVNYDTIPEFVAATRWIADQGIPIVSHSNSFLSPPFNGAGPGAAAVDAAFARGVLWINSAGNYGRRHWAGRAGAQGLPLPLEPTAADVLDFSVTASDPRATAEIDVEENVGGAWQAVSRSRAPDRGPGVWRFATRTDRERRLVVRQTAGPPSELEVFSRTASFGDNAVAEGSVPTPGDARGALAVGAVRWTGTALAPYSSQGPTNDGRPKPEVVAPTYINSNPEWPGTAGTSAATAHVAGAAALLRQRWTVQGLDTSAMALRGRLIAGSLDLGPEGPENQFGAGQVRLDTNAPRLSVRLRGGRRPALGARARDAGTLKEIRVIVGDETIMRRRGARIVARLGSVAPRARVVVEAEDMAGNVARERLRAGAPQAAAASSTQPRPARLAR
jgi:hypothetical protein